MKNEVSAIHVNPILAKEYGFPTAIMFNHICFWLEVNKRNKHNKLNGKYWVNQTFDEMSQKMSLLTSKQVRTGIEKLVEAGFLIAEKNALADNKSANWYRLGTKGKDLYPVYGFRGGKIFIKPVAHMGKGSAHMGKDPCPYGQTIYKEDRKKRESSVGDGGPAAPPEQIAKIINAFAPANVFGVTKLFGNTSERKAADEIIQTYGGYSQALELVVRIVDDRIRQGNKYAPTVCKPTEFIRKSDKVQSWIQSKIDTRLSDESLIINV